MAMSNTARCPRQYDRTSLQSRSLSHRQLVISTEDSKLGLTTDKYETISATLKIIFFAGLSCITAPSNVVFSHNTDGSGMLSADTIVGPIGAN